MGSARRSLNREVVLSRALSIASVVMGVGVLGAFVAGVHALEGRAAGYSRARAAKVVIHWPVLGSGVSWMPAAEQERLTQVAEDALAGDPDVLSPAPLERVGRALSATGWFEGYPRVERAGTGAIEVRGVWQVPAAVVRWGGKEYMISWQARALPMVYREGTSAMPVIAGAAKGPPMNDGEVRFGEAWEGEDVGAALELLRLALEQPWSNQVGGIDLSRYAGEEALVLVSRAGNRIVWGGRPSKPRLGEVSTRTKLIHLSQLKHDFGSIDAGYPLIYVNTARVQFDTSATAREGMR
jgi:hypothetical protein